MKFHKIIGCLVTFMAMASFAAAADFKIAVVDLNRALNESESGIRSRNILESKGLQRQQEIQDAEAELRKDFEDLQNNLLLGADAKARKEQELREQELALREMIQQFEQELRTEERQLTEEIFRELKTAIRTVSLREKFDIVLEKTASEVILYMKMDTTDITQKVIDHYNSLKAVNNSKGMKKK